MKKITKKIMAVLITFVMAAVMFIAMPAPVFAVSGEITVSTASTQAEGLSATITYINGNSSSLVWNSPEDGTSLGGFQDGETISVLIAVSGVTTAAGSYTAGLSSGGTELDSLAFLTTIKGVTDSRNVPLSFTLPTGGLDDLAVTLTFTPTAITSLTPANATISYAGGSNGITVNGTDLPPGIMIGAFLGAATSPSFSQDVGAGTPPVYYLTFPVNISTTNNVYTIKASLDGGTTWLASPTTTVTVTALPAITITTQPTAVTSVTEGYIEEYVEVIAGVTQSASLSYQWYETTTPVNTGGTPVAFETNFYLYIPQALTVGTYYYYCLVSATGGAASVASDVATVNVYSTDPVFVDPPTLITDTSVDAVFPLDANFDDVIGVKFNGVDLTGPPSMPAGAKIILSGYPVFSGAVGSVTQGSTVVTLNSAFLSFLPDGNYTLSVSFRVGETLTYESQTITFEIKRTTPPTPTPTPPVVSRDGGSPPTGDPTNLAGLWAILIASALGALYLVWRHRRQFRNQEK